MAPNAPKPGPDRNLAEAARRLAEAGLEDPLAEAHFLRRHTPDAAAFAAAIARRAAREPAAFILGEAGFWTLDLAVSPATLIPRPDTETLIDAALALFPDRQASLAVLDLGTGTGALLLAALAEYPNATGLGLDRNPDAARLAAANAQRNGLAARAAFLAADWASPLRARFDLILANPPYIETATIPGLAPEVAAHEPALALDGGPDGLAAYRAILPALPDLLAPSGAAILELGAGQAPRLSKLAEAAGLRIEALRPDLAGLPRALVLKPA